MSVDIRTGDRPAEAPTSSAATRAARNVERVARHLASLPSRAAFLLGSIPLLEDAVLRPRYERALLEHRSKLPHLDPTQGRILDDLRTRGVALTSLDEMAVVGSEELLSSARTISEDLARQARRPENVGKQTVQATSTQLLEHPGIFRWGLSDWVLQIVECYLGLPVGYDGLSYYYSVADGREAGPRQWHRDREDRRMLKVALYVNDVDDLGGPFQTLPPEISRRVGDPRQFDYRPLMESDLHDRIGDDTSMRPITCTGPTGTVFFCDTAQYFHRGKPPIAADRSAIFFSYFARPPRHPFLCHRSPLSTKQIRSLVADLSPEQRAAALWDRDVPTLLRWVPKNFIKV